MLSGSGDYRTSTLRNPDAVLQDSVKPGFIARVKGLGSNIGLNTCANFVNRVSWIEAAVSSTTERVTLGFLRVGSGSACGFR